MNNYTIYDVTITLLTPLHIGSGRDLLHQYDYAIHQGRTWRINEDALLDAQEIDDVDGVAALALADRLARTPPGRLLLSGDFRPNASFFRYVIRGTPRSGAEGAQVREQLKDAYDCPYLPGTSLKGALRTALAWHAWGERQMRPRRDKLERNPKFAAQRYERDIFGANPNHDLLRALHVSDSEPVGDDRLMLANARVLHRGGRTASPIELEAIRPETVFRLRLKLDNALFSEWAVRHGLRLRGGDWLERLPAIVQSHTAQRLSQEVGWFTGVPDAEQITGFYRQLQRVRLPDGDFLLQLGWGTGWEGKTLGSRLQDDAGFMEGILRSRREGGYGLARGRRERGDPFPKSRRIVVQVARQPGGRILERPVAPLGWLRVQITPYGVPRKGETQRPAVIEPPTPPKPPPEPSQPQSQVDKPVPPKSTLPSIAPGSHTGTVTYFNLKHGKGRILPDGSETEIEVQIDQLRAGVRYLVKDQKVSFTVVQDDAGIHLKDIGPV